MNNGPKIYDIDESAIRDMHPVLRNTHWPLAGIFLDDALRAKHDLPSIEQETAHKRRAELRYKKDSIIARNERALKKNEPPKDMNDDEKYEMQELAELDVRKDIDREPVKAVRIPNTHHDYSISSGYLIPYYNPSHASLATRSESRIISRSRAWILNAQPQMNILRTKEEIDQLYNRFVQNSDQLDSLDVIGMNEKCAEFRQLFGAIMSRFEQLGRAIEQGNTYGTTIHSVKSDATAADEPASIAPRPSEETEANSEALNPPEIEHLHAEYMKYWYMLMNPAFLPLLRLVRLTDMKIDFDGVLIDWMREIGKPINVKFVEQEYMNDTNILDKIGESMHSIDQTYDLMRKAMTEGQSGELFTNLAQSFITSHGKEFGIREPADLIKKLDDYTATCRARCGIRSDDAKGFDSIYPKYAALEDFFNAPGGFLQTVRHQSRESQEMRTLRSLLTRGIKLMTRTSYTRIPCNFTAPEVWIPNFNSEDPIEAHMANTMLSEPEKRHVKRCLKAAEGLSETDRQLFLSAQLCSVGQLSAGFISLEQALEKTQVRTPAASR